jgi:ABC-type Fe3+ transport system substrate-binding protein
MNKIQINTSIQFEEEPHEIGHLNFLGYAPCVFKHTFKEGLDGVLGAYRKETGTGFKSYVPVGCGSNASDIYDNIWKTPNIEDFPDTVASMTFGDFFRKGFVERFVNKGYFKSVWSTAINEPFEKAGFRDPDGWYTIYAVMPFVMLIDKKKLGNLPAPERWSDLLKPEFRNKVIISGMEDQVADVPLLYLYKEHGEVGLRQLAVNVKTAWPAAQIARTAGSSNPSGAAVYILSWFFAKSCPRTETTSIIWPEDGAYANPLYLLVKKSRMKQVTTITDYVTGLELGRQCALSCFPSLHPHVDNNLPKNASFKWLGWDYIKSHDPAEVREYVHNVFISEWKKSNRGDKQ